MASSRSGDNWTGMPSEWTSQTLAARHSLLGTLASPADLVRRNHDRSIGQSPTEDTWTYTSSSKLDDGNTSRSSRPFALTQRLSQTSQQSPEIFPRHKLQTQQRNMPEESRPQSFWNTDLRSPNIRPLQQSPSTFAHGMTSSPQRSHHSHLSTSLFPAEEQEGISPPNQYWLGDSAWQGSNSNTSSNSYNSSQNQAPLRDLNHPRQHRRQHTNSQDLGHPSSSLYLQQLQFAQQQQHQQQRLEQQQYQVQQHQQQNQYFQSPYQATAPPILSLQPPRSRGSQHQTRRPSNRDEFQGHHYFLPVSSHPASTEPTEASLPQLPTSLTRSEQQEILQKVHQRLCRCAFDFLAFYKFAIPADPIPDNTHQSNPPHPRQEDLRRPAHVPSSSSFTPQEHLPQISRPEDRTWSWWAHLLKRLATKRRIPARVLYGEQIGSMVSVLESSLIGSNDVVQMSHQQQQQQSPHQQHGAQGDGDYEDMSNFGNARSSSAPRDDRNLLQIISAGLQVARLLKDASAMRDLDAIYGYTEDVILSRRRR